MQLFEALVLPALPLPDRQDVALAVSALGVMLLACRRRRRRLARLLPLLFDADGLRLNSHHCGGPRSYHVLATGILSHCSTLSTFNPHKSMLTVRQEVLLSAAEIGNL